jgi:hypothetical protein
MNILNWVQIELNWIQILLELNLIWIELNPNVIELSSNSIEEKMGCKLVQKILKICLSLPSFMTLQCWKKLNSYKKTHTHLDLSIPF